MTETRQYLARLYARSLEPDGNSLSSDTEIEIRSFRPAKKGAVHTYRSAVSLADTEALIASDLAAPADVYNGVHLRRRGAGKAGESSVEVLTAVIADLDVAKSALDPGVAMATIMGSPFGPPSMLVASGGGFHAYWVYDQKTEATDEAHAHHRALCAYIRAWLNERLAPAPAPGEKPKAVADDMSTRDRILRPAGTRNLKPERAVAGVPPRVELLAQGPDVNMAGLLALVPPGFNPDAGTAKAKKRGKPGTGLQHSDLPTSIPARVHAALLAAGIGYKPMGAGGHIEALKLFPCPACGQSDGGCWLSPNGTLRTYHQTTCPAHGPGIPLATWVARYAPKAAKAVSGSIAPAPKADKRATTLASLLQHLGLAELPAGALKSCSEAARIGAQFVDIAWCGGGDALPIPRRGPESYLRQLIPISAHEPFPALLAARDGEGVVRQGAWLSGALLPPAIAPSRGDDQVAGHVLVLGSLPAAIARSEAGETLYLTLTVPDYLAAVGLLELMGQAGPVLCTLGHGQDVMQYIATEWARRDARPGRCVIFASSGQGDDIARPLAGAVGVQWFEFAGGLDAALRGHGGVDAAKRRLAGATSWLHRPPVPFKEARERVMSDLRQAVILAANTSRDDRPTVVVFTPPPGVGKSTQAQILAGQIATGEFQIPITRSRPAGYPQDQWPPPERAVGFATPNHTLSLEKFNDHEKLGVQSPRVQYKGALAHCTYAVEGQRARQAIVEAYPHVGRRGICGDKGSKGRCELAEQGCKGAESPEAQRGEVSYVTQAMAVQMTWDFVFLDEDTGVVMSASADSGAVASLFAGKLIARVAQWRNYDNADAVMAAQLISAILAPLARQHGADCGANRVAPYPRRITGDELCRILELNPHAVDSLLAGFHAKAVRPPSPFPEELRSGVHAGRHMPNLKAFSILQALRDYYVQTRGLEKNPLQIIGQDATSTPHPIVVLVLNEDGNWHLEKLSVKPLPKAPAILLDATGELTLEEYRAAYKTHRVVMMGMSVWGTKPRKALHAKTKGVSRNALHLPSGLLKQGAPRTVERLVSILVEETRRAYPRAQINRDLRIGVLTYKSVHDWMLGQNIVQQMAAHGVELLLGYFGRDDRGTNRFERVDGLAVIGDARANMGVVESHCQLLRLDTAAVMASRAQAILVQALFRARHSGRPAGSEPVILLASGGRPHMAGIAWDEINDMGGETAGMGRGLAYEMVVHVANELGVAGAKVLQLYDWSTFAIDDPLSKVSPKIIQTAVAEVMKERRGWQQYQIATGTLGRPPVIWGETEAAVALWAKINAICCINRTGSNKNIVSSAS